MRHPAHRPFRRGKNSPCRRRRRGRRPSGPHPACGNAWGPVRSPADGGSRRASPVRPHAAGGGICHPGPGAPQCPDRRSHGLYGIREWAELFQRGTIPLCPHRLLLDSRRGALLSGGRGNLPGSHCRRNYGGPGDRELSDPDRRSQPGGKLPGLPDPSGGRGQRRCFPGTDGHGGGGVRFWLLFPVCRLSHRGRGGPRGAYVHCPDLPEHRRAGHHLRDVVRPGRGGEGDCGQLPDPGRGGGYGMGPG